MTPGGRRRGVRRAQQYGSGNAHAGQGLGLAHRGGFQCAQSIAVGGIGVIGYVWGVTEAVRFPRSRPADYQPQEAEPGAEPDLGDGTGTGPGAGPLIEPV